MSFPFHPFLAGAYPVVSLYAAHAEEVLLAELWMPLAISLAVSVVCWWLAGAQTESTSSQGVIATFLVLALLTFGNVQLLLYREGIPWITGRISYFRHERLFAIVFLLLFLAFYQVLRRVRASHDMTALLNLIALFLIAYNGGLAGVKDGMAWWNLHQSQNASIRFELAPDDSNPSDFPDIYVLMLDAYGGPEALKQSYSADGEDFLRALRERNFYVADRAKGNYPFTPLSVASSLNMRYILEPSGKPEGTRRPWRRDGANQINVTTALRFSTVARALQRCGYEYITFRTGFADTETPNSDTYLDPSGSMSELTRAFYDGTIVNAAFRIFGIQTGYEPKLFAGRRRLDYVFDELPKLGPRNHPIFVYAHILAPHAPFVYLADGSAPQEVLEYAADAPMYFDAYSEQLQYTCRRVLEVVDGIIEHSPGAVIVVQGDHGPRFENAAEEFEWEAYARDWLCTINAFRLPGAGTDQLYPEISQVNTFPVIFNEYFDAELELLPDVSYLTSVEVEHQLVPVEWDGNTPVAIAGR